jgi:plasmid stabilization system protein ParE
VAGLYLTRRVLTQFQKIRDDSVAKRGEKVASSYMQNIEDVLNMLAEYPNLLLQRDYAPHLRFYPVADYMLVCMTIDDDVYVLAIYYGGLDIARLMRRQEGMLLREAEILHQKVQRSKDKSR